MKLMISVLDKLYRFQKWLIIFSSIRDAIGRGGSKFAPSSPSGFKLCLALIQITPTLCIQRYHCIPSAFGIINPKNRRQVFRRTRLQKSRYLRRTHTHRLEVNIFQNCLNSFKLQLLLSHRFFKLTTERNGKHEWKCERRQSRSRHSRTIPLVTTRVDNA